MFRDEPISERAAGKRIMPKRKAVASFMDTLTRFRTSIIQVVAGRPKITGRPRASPRRRQKADWIGYQRRARDNRPGTRNAAAFAHPGGSGKARLNCKEFQCTSSPGGPAAAHERLGKPPERIHQRVCGSAGQLLGYTCCLLGRTPHIGRSGANAAHSRRFARRKKAGRRPPGCCPLAGELSGLPRKREAFRTGRTSWLSGAAA